MGGHSKTVTGQLTVSPFAGEFGLLSLRMMWVMPALYPANPKRMVFFVVGQDLTKGASFFAFVLGQYCRLPFLGLLMFDMVFDWNGFF